MAFLNDMTLDEFLHLLFYVVQQQKVFVAFIFFNIL